MNRGERVERGCLIGRGRLLHSAGVCVAMQKCGPAAGTFWNFFLSMYKCWLKKKKPNKTKNIVGQ